MPKPDPCQRQACAIQKCLEGITNLLKPFSLLIDTKNNILILFSGVMSLPLTTMSRTSLGGENQI
jgi:hypothetical protein